MTEREDEAEKREVRQREGGRGSGRQRENERDRQREMGGRYDNSKENLCPHLAAFTGILGVMEPGGLVVPAYLAPGVRLQVAGPVGCNQKVNTLVRSTAQNTPICPTPGSWACRLQPKTADSQHTGPVNGTKQTCLSAVQ